MLRDYYYLREVILGLREEYLKNEDHLRNLKPLVDANDHKIEGFNFLIRQTDYGKPELYCEIEKKKNCIEKMVTKILKNMNYFPVDISDRGICLKNNNDEYFIQDDRFSVLVKDLYKEQFAENVQQILNSSFANQIKVNYLEFISNQVDSSLFLTHSMIHFIERDIGLSTDSYLTYKSRDDKLSYHTNREDIKGFLLDEYFARCLEAQIPREFLSSYHQDIIEQSDSFNKPISIVKSFCSSDCFPEYTIEPDGKQFILRKVK